METKTCVWKQDDIGSDCWDTSCKNAFYIEEGTPEENRLNFCCFCGNKIEQVLYNEDQDETD